MKKSVVLLMIFLTINLFGQVNSEISNTQKKSVETDSGKEDIYYIQRGDRLTIEVMEHPEFSKRVQVLPDGTIEYPILGKIKTEGMTVNILKSVIKSNLLPYVPSPIVSIYVSEIYGEKINIIGYINSPGNYQIYKPIGIVDAIAKAGGIVNMRRVKYVKIIRKNGSVINIKISKLWDSDNEKYSPERKLMLRAGDSLIIPT
ncbi:MAG: polysaccharide biosynthesis/export family protein, partial [Candidatus Marinimicrobia bacterium]|nr:polysaccharide biosynthesis/export family protein [Candidatus Neomarinimicrobiota bacterium]